MFKKSLIVLLLMLTSSASLAGGYISGQPLPTAAYVYAFLPNPANTTITVADTYYEIAGPFNNDVIEGFTFVVDHIEYQESSTRLFEIDWHTSVQITSAGETVHLGIKKNTDTPVGIMGTLCKTAGFAYSISGTCVVELQTGDEIQLVATASAGSEVITFNHLITTIRPFGGY